MGFRFSFVIVVLYVTAVLIFAVYLHSVNNSVFYQLCIYRAEQSRLKQQLGNQQLRLESLINPAAISQYLEPQVDTD